MDGKQFSYIVQTLIPSFIVNLYLSLRYRCFIHPGAKIYWPQNLKLGRGVMIGKGTTVIAQGRRDAVVIGDNVIVNDYCVINNKGGTIRIGDRASINHFTMLQGGGHLDIGEDVAVAPYVRFVPNHRMDGGKVLETIHADSTVGNGVWIGAGATVILGSNIGKNAVVGANAVVNKSVGDNEVAVGVPIRILPKK
jgi:acetyltransferase-like isoleucine patch superfamily enzyme